MLSKDEINQAAAELTSYLKSMGYETSGCTPTEKGLAGPSWEIWYANDSAGLKLQFSLFRQQSSYLLSIHRDKDLFYITDFYTTKQDRDSAKKYAEISVLKPQATQESLRASVSELVPLLDSTLKPYLSGEKWESIPFDWGDYK